MRAPSRSRAQTPPEVAPVDYLDRWRQIGSVDEAVAQVAHSLCLRVDDAPSRERLRALLESRLVLHPNGRIDAPVGSTRSAILSWHLRSEPSDPS